MRQESISLFTAKLKTVMMMAQREALVREYGRALNLPYPMDLVEMLEEALELYRRNFGLLFGIALMPALMGVLIMLAFEGVLRLPSQAPLFIVAVIILYALFFLTTVFGHGAQVLAVGRAVMGETIGFWQAWGEIFRRSFVYIITMLLGTLAGMVGICLCGIGVLFTITVFAMLLPQVVLLEKVGYSQAIGRHVQLVFPDWQWARVLGFYLLGYLLVMLVYWLVSPLTIAFFFIVEFVREALPVPTEITLIALMNLWTQLAGALVAPYLAAFLTLLYFDLKARKEATDIELLMQKWESLGKAV